MVNVVGIGPGSPDYIAPAALNRINDAEVLIGAKRVLDSFDVGGKQIHYITADMDAVIKVVEANQHRETAIVVGGDPGFYSILKTLRERLSNIKVNVIPGISSAQFLFSLIGQEWQDVTFTSVHGRTLDEINGIVRDNKKVCILTDDKLTAPSVAKHLLNLGLKGRAVIGKNLSYQDQELIDTRIDKLAKLDGLGSSVLYVELD